MPLYKYHCSCGSKFERLFKVGQKPLEVQCSCGLNAKEALPQFTTDNQDVVRVNRLINEKNRVLKNKLGV